MMLASILESGINGHSLSPSGLGVVDSLVEEVVEEQVLEFRVGTVATKLVSMVLFCRSRFHLRLGDILQEDGADNAATTPHERNLGLVQLPVVLLGGVLDQHETLSIRDDLGCVKSLFEVCDELLLVAGEAGAGAIKKFGSAATLRLEGRKAASKDGLSDQSHGHAEVQGVDGGPLAGTLLTSRIQDLLNNRLTVLVVVLVHDVAGDLNQEGVEHALVPFREDVTDFLVVHSETTLHDIVCLVLKQ